MVFVAVAAFMCQCVWVAVALPKRIWTSQFVFFWNAPKNTLFKLDLCFFDWLARSGNEIYAYNTRADIYTHIIMHTRQFVCRRHLCAAGRLLPRLELEKVTHTTWQTETDITLCGCGIKLTFYISLTFYKADFFVLFGIIFFYHDLWLLALHFAH